MVMSKTFAVVGGDLRYAHLANLLALREEGYRVYGMFLEKEAMLCAHVIPSMDVKLVLPQSDVVIFPLPLLESRGFINTPLSEKRITLEECLDYISPDAVVLAGKVSGESLGQARRRGIELIDYLEREEFAVLNAVPTAEGAVQIALEEMPTTLFGSTCVITGFGRISKVLARLLVAFGAKVKVMARKCSDLAWIRLYGCEAVPASQLSEALSKADIVFNTVPTILLDEKKLTRLKRECLIIDLASKPGGVDFETAKQLGVRVIWALSLPGKVAPISAGEITLDTIFNILNEKELIKSCL